MDTVSWTAFLTVNDREDGDRHVTITSVSFSKTEDDEETD